MDAMADISNLLTEFNAKKRTFANAIDKAALEKDIIGLEKAWNSGNADDAKKHATNSQKFAKKFKAKLSITFWQTIESIASGDSVPQKMNSSTRPSSKYRKESETAAASRGSTTQQPVKKESETAAASRGSTTKQPVKNKSQNEKESEQERVIDVKGIKVKAQQRQSEKSMVQKLRIIRNHIEDLDTAMRPRPNDVKNSNSKGEECNSLVEIILNQSAEVLNAYRQEKDRISVTENRLKKMFQNATGREYKGPSNNGRKEKKEDQTDTVEVLQQLINDMDRQLVEYKSQHDIIHQERGKSKEELENLHKRISDTEKMLKDMFQHATGQNYKESSNKDGTRKPDSVEILQQTIYDLEKQLTDYTRMTDTEKRLREMFQHVTGRDYRGPSILDGKGKKKENQFNTVEVLHKMIADMDKQLVNYTSQQDKVHKDSVNPKQELEHLQKRMTKTGELLREMFQHVTGRDYKGPSISDEKEKTDNQFNTMDVLHQMIADMDKQLVDHTRMTDTEKRLREMFQHVTGREYRGPSISDRKGKKEENQYDTLEVLHQMIADMDKQLADYTSLSKQLSNEKQLNEKLSREKDELLIRLSQHVSAKLTNNNPDIADLSDENRPTKLGELYSELYDNEWTDAYEVLNINMNEKDTISLLLEVLTTSYAYCLRHSQNQEMLLEGLLMLPASTLSGKEGFGTNGFEEMKKLLKSRPTLGDLEQKRLMDLRKATKSISAENVVQIGVDYVKKDLTKDDPSDIFRTYVQKCLHLCWLMCQQSPRMFIEVNLTKYSGTKFDKSAFREYLKFGKKVDYVVWPPLYLYEGGCLVKKGVANGK